MAPPKSQLLVTVQYTLVPSLTREPGPSWLVAIGICIVPGLAGSSSTLPIAAGTLQKPPTAVHATTLPMTAMASTPASWLASGVGCPVPDQVCTEPSVGVQSIWSVPASVQ
jgi:hypothetical protein